MRTVSLPRTVRPHPGGPWLEVLPFQGFLCPKRSKMLPSQQEPAGQLRVFCYTRVNPAASPAGSEWPRGTRCPAFPRTHLSPGPERRGPSENSSWQAGSHETQHRPADPALGLEGGCKETSGDGAEGTRNRANRRPHGLSATGSACGTRPSRTEASGRAGLPTGLLPTAHGQPNAWQCPLSMSPWLWAATAVS